MPVLQIKQTNFYKNHSLTTKKTAAVPYMGTAAVFSSIAAHKNFSRAVRVQHFSGKQKECITADTLLLLCTLPFDNAFCMDKNTFTIRYAHRLFTTRLFA